MIDSSGFAGFWDHSLFAALWCLVLLSRPINRLVNSIHYVTGGRTHRAFRFVWILAFPAVLFLLDGAVDVYARHLRLAVIAFSASELASMLVIEPRGMRPAWPWIGTLLLRVAALAVIALQAIEVQGQGVAPVLWFMVITGLVQMPVLISRWRSSPLEPE